MQYVTRLHHCLTDGKLAAGMFISLNSPSVAELLVGSTEMDFVGVDLQHAAVNSSAAVHLLRAIQAADPMVTPLTRVPNHDVYWIQQSLDVGYTGLIVPLVESRRQAEALVRVAYYPPAGARSIAGSIRASLYSDYISTSNQRMILLPQIESAAGLDHVEEIVAVDGITGVFVGPADLSLSCGWRNEDLWSYEPFLAAIQRVINACGEHGKAAGILVVGDDMIAARKAGFNLVGFGSDAAYIRLNVVSDVNARLQQLRSGTQS